MTENPLGDRDTWENRSTAKRDNIRPFTVLQEYLIYIAGQRRKIWRLLQMYAFYEYVAIVNSYGLKKDDLK